VRFAPGPLPTIATAVDAGEAPVPGPGELRRAAEIAASVEDENLRKSVEKAVSLGLARRASDRPV
jgi:hypothetical protein